MHSLKGTILIVDDSKIVRRTLRYGLEINGHAVDEAANGVDAFTMLRRKDYDLIFLDIEMPQMNGFQVLKALQKDTQLKHIPVIVISANDDMSSTVRCIELGAIDYLNKPFNATLLNARVISCLEKKKLRDNEIAQQKELENLYHALKKADAAKDEFVAMVAHELRNPITGLFAAHQILQRLNQDITQNSVLERMYQSLESLRLLINDLNDISRIENDNLRLEFGRVFIPTVIDRVIDSLKHKVEQKMHTLTLQLTDSDVAVYGDEFRIVQILTNLVSNSVKYTQDNGRITISVRRYKEDCNQLHITVRDNGIGMEQSAADHIFDKYYRDENDDTRKVEGIGLGMFITKNLVEKHGGSIWIQTARREGTAVHFTLPLVRNEEWANDLDNDTFSSQDSDKPREENVSVPTD